MGVGGPRIPRGSADRSSASGRGVTEEAEHGGACALTQQVASPPTSPGQRPTAVAGTVPTVRAFTGSFHLRDHTLAPHTAPNRAAGEMTSGTSHTPGPCQSERDQGLGFASQSSSARHHTCHGDAALPTFQPWPKEALTTTAPRWLGTVPHRARSQAATHGSHVTVHSGRSPHQERVVGPLCSSLGPCTLSP